MDNTQLESRCSSPGTSWGGHRQARDGVLTLIRDRQLDVDLLMIIAAIGAAAIGEWFDGALLIFIFALSGGAAAKPSTEP